MKLEVEIKPDHNGSIQIIDYSREFDYYIPEEFEGVLPYYDKFKFSDTCTIDVLSYISSSEEQMLNVFFTPHDLETNSISIELPKDGYYSIQHLVLPTVDWFNKVQVELIDDTTEGSDIIEEKVDLLQYSGIYITDGRFIYKSIAGQLIVVDPIEVIQRNPDMTTISIVKFQIFSVDRLRQCYINTSLSLFEGYLSRCKSLNEVLKFNRDFLWMTLNVISYYLDWDRYSEAQIVLEQLGCSNLCPDNVQLIQSTSCGCHH